MAELSSADPDSGIDFPVLAGKVSTTAVGRAAAAAAAGAVDKREAAYVFSIKKKEKATCETPWSSTAVASRFQWPI